MPLSIHTILMLKFIGKAYLNITCFAIGGLFLFAGLSIFPAVTASSLFCFTIGATILYCLIDPFGLSN